jgi:sugar O-acyltransferase (sialic acid O-acetyltransferase NeuD family)
MNGLLIVGAGGHGRVVADAALLTEQWSSIAFLDDRMDAAQGMDGVPVIGKIVDARCFLNDYQHVLIALGDNKLRIRILDQLLNDGFKGATIIHPRASISPGAILETGTVVFAQAAVNYGAHIGKGCIINTGATIDHDCDIGKGVHVSPGVHLAGDVKIGKYSWIGIGASVIGGIHINNDVIVGAGTVVIRNVSAFSKVVGVPGRVI